jgi:hypothetical protein
LLFSFILLCFCTSSYGQQWSGIVDPSRATDWSNAGVQGGIPNRTTICTTLNPGATASQINSAISGCPANQVVFLSAGTYNLSGAINISKSNVTLRGAGANQTLLHFTGSSGCNGPFALVCIRASAYIEPSGPPNSTTWTAGYAPGTNVITVGSTSGMAVGRVLILDQLNDGSDNGDLFICSAGSCTGEGGNAFGRNNRGQQQLVKITAISGNQVTISPPIRMPNWRASQQPGAYWNGNASMVTGSGVEDLSIDGTNEPAYTLAFSNVSDSWARGIRTINADRGHVFLWQSMRITVRDSYFYGNQGGASQSYGVEDFSTGDNLIENNIFHHVTLPLSHNGSNTGSVFGYNFAYDHYYTSPDSYILPTALYHEVGISYLLHEGNDGAQIRNDNIHGTTHLNTEFRNHLYGDVCNCPAKTDNTQTIYLEDYSRFFNIVGNVLGRTGYYNVYQGSSSRAIFDVAQQARNVQTLFRWGNYDTVNNAVRWESSEVPSGLANFANAVPATQNLPASFYLNSKPAFFGSVPWPPIGPDVTGGNIAGYAGHANKIPARLCYENTPKTNNILNFNAAACYQQNRPAPPTNLSIIVQ